jgi:hypothetical protein
MGSARTPTPKPSYFHILSIYNCKWSKWCHNTLSRQVHWWSPCRKSAKWCAEVRTLGLCNCDWPTCVSPNFFSRQILQISEQYGLIDFLLYDSRKIFYYVSYNNKLAYYVQQLSVLFKYSVDDPRKFTVPSFTKKNKPATNTDDLIKGRKSTLYQ